MADVVNIQETKQYIKNVIFFYNTIFDFIFQSMIEKKYLVISLSIIFLIIGLVRYQKSTPYFETKATFYYIELNKKIYGEMLDKINVLAETKSYKLLSQKLNISEKEASGILAIKGLNIANSPLSEDITEVKVPFYIQIKILDRNIADKVLYGLEFYLNSNRVGKEIIENNIVKLKRRIVFLDAELQKIDSLRLAYNYYLTQTNINSNKLVNNLSIKDIFKKSEEVFIERNDLELTLKNYKSVHILDNFIVPDAPTKLSLIVEIVKFLIIGILISILLSVFLQIKNRI